MKIFSDINLCDFQFWSGARDRVENLTNDDFEVIERELEALYPDGIDDGELNDLFWFDFDMIAKFLGYENEADFDRKTDESYIDDDELMEHAGTWFKTYLQGLRQQSEADDPKAKESQELIENIADCLFSYDDDEFCKDYSEQELETNPELDSYWKRAYQYLMQPTSNETIFEILFDDDQGEFETDGSIPSKEGFRDLIMSQPKVD